MAMLNWSTTTIKTLDFDQVELKTVKIAVSGFLGFFFFQKLVKADLKFEVKHHGQYGP